MRPALIVAILPLDAAFNARQVLLLAIVGVSLGLRGLAMIRGRWFAGHGRGRDQVGNADGRRMPRSGVAAPAPLRERVRGRLR